MRRTISSITCSAIRDRPGRSSLATADGVEPQSLWSDTASSGPPRPPSPRTAILVCSFVATDPPVGVRLMF